jgi:hypothetical protein
MSLGRFTLLSLGFGFALPLAAQQKFESTTDNTTQEKVESKGINEATVEGMPESTKKLMKKFQEGRVSSKYDGKSRYSSILEMHDFNQDGVSDHDKSGNRMEGGMDEIAIGQKGTGGKERKEALQKARDNAGNCQDGKGSAAQGNACFNLSGIIIDTGGAHGGAKAKHRTYRVTDEAAKAAEEAGKEYGSRAIKEGRYGGDGKQVDMDVLRSEAAWLEQQKRHMTEAAWKTLRAARLAGIDTSATPDDAFMQKIGNMLSNEEGDAAIAQEVVLKGRTDSTPMCNVGGNWGVCNEESQTKAQKAISDEIAAKEASFRALRPEERAEQERAIREKYSLNMVELTKKETAVGNSTYQLEEQVRAAVLANEAKLGPEAQKNLQEEFAKAENCMGKDKWCYGGVGVNNVAAAQAAQPPGSTPAKLPDRFDESTGDPGIVFNDTREIIYNNLSKAQVAPVNQIQKIMESADFDKSKYPEFYEQLEQVKKEAKELEDSDPANFDADTQSVPQMFGIRQGVNDTFAPNAPKDGPAPASAGGGLAAPSLGGAIPRPQGAGVTGPATPNF